MSHPKSKKSKLKKPETSKPTSATGPAPATPIELVGSQQAYEHVRPDAAALAADEVRAFRADASLAYHNVKTGVDALLAIETRIAAELPTLSLKGLRGLGDLALAVAYAVAQVDRGADGSTAVLLAKARELREIMLVSAEALAKSGVIPARAVEKIREGRGAIDSAQDCVDLAALFSKYSKDVKGKTAVTSAQRKDAAELGTELLKRLRRKGTKRKDSAIVAAAVEARDRVWTLLVQRHQEVRRAGMWIWGDDVDAHVPPLQSRAMPPRKKKGVEAPAAAVVKPAPMVAENDG
jgi:hypothetical protein